MRRVAMLEARLHALDRCQDVLDDAIQYLKVDLEKVARQQERNRFDEKI
jgi:hypothetical protein